MVERSYKTRSAEKVGLLNAISIKKSNNTYLKYVQKTEKESKRMEAEKRTWEEFDRRIEDKRKGNQKLFYRVLMGLRERNQETSKNGSVLTKDEEMMNIDGRNISRNYCV